MSGWMNSNLILLGLSKTEIEGFKFFFVSFEYLPLIIKKISTITSEVIKPEIMRKKFLIIFIDLELTLDLI